MSILVVVDCWFPQEIHDISDIRGNPWIFIEIHGNPWISRNIHQFPKNPGYYWISGNPDFPDIHGNPCMPELPYMDIQGHTWISMDGTPRKVGRDINI